MAIDLFKNNPRESPGEEVTPVSLPSPPGWLKLRYITRTGKYLGEVELFAVDPEAANIMTNDLREKLGGLIIAKG